MGTTSLPENICDEEDQRTLKVQPMRSNDVINDINDSHANTTADSSPVNRIEIVWMSVIRLAVLHLGAVYGLYLSFSGKWATWIWAICYYLFAGHGITGGAHRLWSHRTFKAKWPLRLLAAVAQTAAGQLSIYEWARDHRVHHKFSETNADPHNAKRGFFFAHMGWLIMCKKHPEVIRCGKMIDCSDLLADPIVYYQYIFFLPLYLTFNFAVPSWQIIELYKRQSISKYRSKIKSRAISIDP